METSKMNNMNNYNMTYRLAYDFHARWFPYPKDLLAWERSLDDVRALLIDNDDNPFLRDVLTNIMEEMERCYQAQLPLRKSCESFCFQQNDSRRNAS